MKKWIPYLCAALALCLVAVGVFVVIALSKNPNVGLCFAVAEEAQPLKAALEEAELVVNQAEPEKEAVLRLSESCTAVVVELTSPQQAAAYADAPAVFVGCRPQQEAACYVGGDCAQAGLALGQLLLEQPERGDWNGDGTVTCLLLGAESQRSDMQQCATGIRLILANAGLQVAFVPVTEQVHTAQAGKTVCEELLSDYGKDLEAVIVYDDTALSGVTEALGEGGRLPGRSVTLLSVGHSSRIAQLVQTGDLCGYAYIEEESFCQAVLRAVQAMDSGKAPESMILEYVPVTAK